PRRRESTTRASSRASHAPRDSAARAYTSAAEKATSREYSSTASRKDCSSSGGATEAVWDSTTSTMIRTRCSVCCREIERVSSGGAARKISAALYAVCPSLSYHAMKFLIPDCTTSPIQERSSAGSARYHGRLSSSRFSAALVRRSVPPRRRRTSSWEAGG